MAYIRRRRYGAKRPVRRRMGMKKRILKKNYKKYHGVKYHTVKAVGFANLTSAATGTGGTNTNQSVTFTNVPGFADYASLYKQYAILGVKYIYTPRYNTTASFGGTGFPRLFVVEDKMEISTVPISVLQEQDNVKVVSANKSWSKYVKKPQPLLLQQNTAGAQVQAQRTSRQITWLDTNNNVATAIPHLGMLIDIEDNATANPIVCGELTVQFYLAFKEQQ